MAFITASLSGSSVLITDNIMAVRVYRVTIWIIDASGTPILYTLQIQMISNIWSNVNNSSTQWTKTPYTWQLHSSMSFACMCACLYSCVSSCMLVWECVLRLPYLKITFFFQNIPGSSTPKKRFPFWKFSNPLTLRDRLGDCNHGVCHPGWGQWHGEDWGSDVRRLPAGTHHSSLATEERTSGSS